MQSVFDNDTFFEIISRKALDEVKIFEVTPWERDESGYNLVRTVKYQFVKTIAFSRNVINVEQSQTKSLMIPGRMYAVDTITQNAGVMYADYIRTLIHFRFTREDLYNGDRTVKENRKKTRLQVVADIEFLKPCIFKGRIENETWSSLKKYYEIVEKELESYGANVADQTGDSNNNIPDNATNADPKYSVTKGHDGQGANDNSSRHGYHMEDFATLKERYQYRENVLSLAFILLLVTMLFVTLAMFKLSSTMSLLNDRMNQIEQANILQIQRQEDFLKGINFQTPKL